MSDSLCESHRGRKGREQALGDRDLSRVQGPGAGAAQQKRIAELRLAGERIGEVAEWSVERLDAASRAGVHHLGNRLVPEVLLEGGPSPALAPRGGDPLATRMAAAHPPRL